MKVVDVQRADRPTFCQCAIPRILLLKHKGYLLERGVLHLALITSPLAADKQVPVELDLEIKNVLGVLEADVGSRVYGVFHAANQRREQRK